MLKILGMHCASCKALIEDVCREIPGVLNCEVNLEEAYASVTHNGSVHISTLKQAIGGLGAYRVEML